MTNGETGIAEFDRPAIRGRSVADVLRGHAAWLAKAEGAWRADLSGLTLNDEVFQDASLEKALLIGATLLDANLSGCILIEAQMTGADLERAQLSGADLTGA